MSHFQSPNRIPTPITSPSSNESLLFHPPTPTNTHVTSPSHDTTDLRDTLDSTESWPPLVDAVCEHLRDFADSLPIVAEDEGPEERGPGSPATPPGVQPPAFERGRSPLPTASGQRRSSSVPVKPLKSALAASPPCSPPRVGTRRKKKSAHWVDERVLRRTVTEPGRAHGVKARDAALPDVVRMTLVGELLGDDAEAGELLGNDAEVGELPAADFGSVRDSTRADGFDDETCGDAIGNQSHALQETADDAGGNVDDNEPDEDGRRESFSITPDMETDEPDLLDLAEIQRFDSLKTEGSPSDTAIEDDDFIPTAADKDELPQGPELDMDSSMRGPSTLSHRRLSVPETSTIAEPKGICRRASSMSDFTRVNRHLKSPLLTPKASPAHTVLTACSVRTSDPPRLNTVYEHAGDRHVQASRVQRPTKTAQTVCSGSSTYQMIWEEPPRRSEDSDVTLLEQPGTPEITVQDDSLLSHISRAPSPMGHVRSKLAAWSWAREQEGDDDQHPSLPLMAIDERGSSRQPSEMSDPSAPPNTEGSGLSSVWHSGPQSPVELHDDGETESRVELRFKTTLARPHHSHLEVPVQSLDRGASLGAQISPVSRQLSNLAAADEHFRSHRDSLDLSHRKIKEERMNEQLMATRDSFLLTRSKYDAKHPKHTANPKTGFFMGFNRFGALSPIIDASPPDSRLRSGLKIMARAAGSTSSLINSVPTTPAALPLDYNEPHPDEHVGCAPCALDRPRWHEYHHPRGGRYDLHPSDPDAAALAALAPESVKPHDVHEAEDEMGCGLAEIEQPKPHGMHKPHNWYHG